MFSNFSWIIFVPGVFVFVFGEVVISSIVVWCLAVLEMKMQ